MSKIDWSKAPEDATHAGTDSFQRICWYKYIANNGYMYQYSKGNDTGKWYHGAAGSPAHQPLERRPEEKQKDDWCLVGKRVWIKAEAEHERIQWDIDQIDERRGVLISSILGRYWKRREELEPVINTLSNARAPKPGEGLAALMKRPEPKWVPGGLPPVGSKLIIKATSQNCEIVCKYRNGVVYYVFATEKFAWTDSDRIFISHRDKVIEAADKLIEGKTKSAASRHHMGILYDAGFLKLPEGE